MAFRINQHSIHTIEDVQSLPVSIPQRAEILRLLSAFLNPNSQGISIKTSGSTGPAKQFFLTRKQIVNSALRTGAYFKFNQDQKILHCLSMKRIGGIMLLLRAFIYQQDLVVVYPNSDPFQNTSSNNHYFFASLVPMQVFKLLESTSSNFIKHVLIGGAGISQALQDKIDQHQEMHFYHSYGMTETISHVAIRNIKIEDKFKALPGVSLSQSENGTLIIDDQVLSIKSLKTNDLVELDEHNEFVFVGRLDSVINTGGIKIVLEELEEKIKSNLNSDDLCLFWKKDDYLGQALLMAVSGDLKLPMLNKLRQFLKPHQTPKSVYYLKQLPQTESGKIDRMRLMARFN